MVTGGPFIVTLRASDVNEIGTFDCLIVGYSIGGPHDRGMGVDLSCCDVFVRRSLPRRNMDFKTDQKLAKQRQVHQLRHRGPT